MNDKEKKAIDMCRLLLNGDITLHVIDDDGGTAYAGTVNKTYNDDLQTVLNLIEKQKAEIEITRENHKNLIEHITILTEPLGLEEDAPIDEMYKEINKLKAGNRKEDKQIDLMANNLIGVVFSNNDNKEILFDNKEDVKEYFKKKAEEDK